MGLLWPSSTRQDALRAIILPHNYLSIDRLRIAALMRLGLPSGLRADGWTAGGFSFSLKRDGGVFRAFISREMTQQFVRVDLVARIGKVAAAK